MAVFPVLASYVQAPPHPGGVHLDPLPAPARVLISVPPPARTFTDVLNDVLEGR